MKNFLLLGAWSFFSGWFTTSYFTTEVPSATYSLRHSAAILEEYEGDDPINKIQTAYSTMFKVSTGEPPYEDSTNALVKLDGIKEKLMELEDSNRSPGFKLYLPKSTYQPLLEDAADAINDTADEHDKSPYDLFLGMFGFFMAGIETFRVKPGYHSTFITSKRIR